MAVARKQELTFADLGAGAGGLGLGFARAGWKPLLHCDINRRAVETLRANGHKNVVLADIREIDLPAGVLAAIMGLPCQPASSASKANGKHGAKHKQAGVHAWFADLIDEQRPHIVIVECGRGYFTEEIKLGVAAYKHSLLPRRIVPVGSSVTLPYYTQARYLDGRLTAMGYRTDFHILSANLYGNCQFRVRVFAVSNNLGLEFAPPAPTHGPGKRRVPRLGRVIRHAASEPCATYSDDDVRMFAGVRPGGTWKDLPPALMREFRRRFKEPNNQFRRLHPDGAWFAGPGEYRGPTICGRISDPLVGFCHWDDARPLSIPEVAAAQGFPKGYVFCGSLDEQYAQIGNAVPLEMSSAVAFAVADGLRRRVKSRRGNAPSVIDLAGTYWQGKCQKKPIPTI